MVIEIDCVLEHWSVHVLFIFVVNIWKRYGQKLRRIILLHFGLVTVLFGYGRDRKPIIFMISGFSDVSTTPKTNIIYFLRHQDTQINPRYTPIMFKNSIYGNINTLEIENCRTILKIRLTKCWTSWIWDQYLPENMKWNFGNMGSLKLGNFETKKPRSQETLKPRNQTTSKPWSFFIFNWGNPHHRST